MKAALNDEKLSEAWKAFEEKERAERKEKMKKHHHKKGKDSNQRMEKKNEYPTK